MPGISLCVITLNEAENIGRCIKSTAGLVDQVLIYDSKSTDETRSIAESLGAQVVEGQWFGYAKTKNKLYSMASESYILALDGDEALSKELYAYLKSIKNDLKVAYRFPRKNNFYGKWMKSRAFYPDHKIRLFPKDKAQWHDSLVHEELIPHPDLEITEVKYDILHYTYKNIAEHQKRLDKYAKLASVRYRDQSKNKLWFKQYFNSSYRFIKNYLLQYAFIDGSAGFTASYLNAKEVYLKYKYARVAK